MTFPVAQREVRDALKIARLIGEQVLEDFVEASKKGRESYCLNWADLSLVEVLLVIDEDFRMILTFLYEEGNCPLFNAHMRERLLDAISGDYLVEVRSEW
jgi:hypothetical protein